MFAVWNQMLNKTQFNEKHTTNLCEIKKPYRNGSVFTFLHLKLKHTNVWNGSHSIVFYFCFLNWINLQNDKIQSTWGVLWYSTFLCSEKKNGKFMIIPKTTNVIQKQNFPNQTYGWVYNFSFNTLCTFWPCVSWIRSTEGGIYTPWKNAW